MNRLLAIFAAFALALAGCSSQPSTHTTITVNGHPWTMELAMGDDAIRRGLMERASLPPQTGMLFIFPRPEYHQFWMAWCVMPIDLVFLDGRGRVVATWEMQVEPPMRPDESEEAYLLRMPSYPSGVPVRFAAEFPAGTIEGQRITRGDRFDMDVDGLLAMERSR